ncbi:MAG: hypothetical protein JXQ23_10680 [Clostridia bacterium]|nr:hypothetical protein [Clostridia bacterium]
MKKSLILILTVVLIVTLLAGCGKEAATPSSTATPTATPAPTESSTDAVTTASIVDNGAALINALSANGTWIAATLNDITLTEDLVVEGIFYNKEVVARKIGPYTQDADHNITASFTITAPKLIVRSENTKFQGGNFVGDIYVNANGFTLSKANITGNIYFETKAYMDSFVIDETSTVSGKKEVTAVDGVTTASIVDNAAALIKAVSKDGAWIACTVNDVTVLEDLIVDGEFISKEKIARKIGPYTQDADHNITASFTITYPKMIVRSENTKLQGGIFVGDIYVEANGFTLSKATVKGNIYYSKQEYKDSSVTDEVSVVTGVSEVK